MDHAHGSRNQIRTQSLGHEPPAPTWKGFEAHGAPHWSRTLDLPHAEHQEFAAQIEQMTQRTGAFDAHIAEKKRGRASGHVVNQSWIVTIDSACLGSEGACPNDVDISAASGETSGIARITPLVERVWSGQIACAVSLPSSNSFDPVSTVGFLLKVPD